MQTKRVRPGDTGQIAAPPIVHEVLAEPGQMLAPATRAFMEPRFGHDFSHVRVHTDAKAAESARSVKAAAYTVGQHLVFREGAFAPDTTEGKRLLAHELAHVIQQGEGRTSVAGVERSDNTRVNEADGDSANREPARSVATTQLRRQADDGGSDAPSAPEQLDDKPKKICGPNVTKQLKDAQLKTRGKFSSWKNSRKESACQDLVSIIFGSIAWDIIQLNESGWIFSNYGSQCASKDASPSCTKSVQIDDQCFYAGSVNYAHFGNMFDLCQGYYASAYPLNNQFTQNEMVKWIDRYKGTGFTGLATPADNFKSSVDWAVAGFFNWPHGASTPKGDRPNCSPTCSLPYTGGNFDVNWSGETF